MEIFFKKSRKSQNKLRIIYPKNREKSKNSKSRVQFYWFLEKKSVVLICEKPILMELIRFSKFHIYLSIVPDQVIPVQTSWNQLWRRIYYTVLFL